MVRFNDAEEYEIFLTVGEDYSAERRDRSLMPYLQGGSAFDWTRYGADCEENKRICNAFFVRYEEFRRQGRGLYIYSETCGSGKTFLACCLANEVIGRYNAVVKFISAADYVQAVKEGQDTESFKQCGLLILDDIGAQSQKREWINEAMFRLVDRRYRGMLPTIYTSNLPFKKASKDDRIMSRIYETSIPVKLPEYSVRDSNADRYREEFLREVLAS